MLSKIWRFLSSIRLALILIFIVAGLCLAGALLIQAPSEIVQSHQMYTIWLQNVAEPRFGFWTSFLRFFDLFNVFHSPLFITAGAFLVVNIIACSVKRWRSISKETTLSPAKGEEFYKTAKGSTELALPTGLAESANIVSGVLRKSGYRYLTQLAGNTAYISADKNRFSRYGTLFSHLSLILFIIAGFVGSWFGFKDTSFIVPEGTTRQVGYGTGLSLTLNSFTDEYWQDDMPKDYRSDVELYRNGKQVESGVIRVNHPMVYNGVYFYQSSFGPAVLISVRDASGEEVFRNAVALSGSSHMGGYTFYSGSFDLADRDLTVRLVGSDAGAADPSAGGQELAVQITRNDSAVPLAMDLIQKGIPHDIGALQFIYLGDLQYSGFQVSRDPGSTLIWIASAILLAGLVMVLYFSYSRVWVHLVAQRDSTRIRMRLTAPRSQAIDSDIIKLRQEIENRRQ